METLREEIATLTALRDAQAALLAWNRETPRYRGALWYPDSTKSGASLETLSTALCNDPAIGAWCRLLPATFGVSHTPSGGNTPSGGATPLRAEIRRTAMTAIDLVLAALVLIAMAALGVTDARRMIVDPRMVLALVCAGLLWRLFGSAETGSLWTAALGAALGVGVVAVPIAWAHLRRRRWPLFPGDAMMLGGLGFVLGPLSLGWALLAGALCSLLHRAWLQRRRGRSFFRGYCPLGPGMAAGAMAVFVFVNAGGALAASDAEIPLPQPKPGAIQEIPSGGDTPVPWPAPPRPVAAAAGQAGMLAATELAPLRVSLPPSLAASEVAVDEPAPLPFAAVTERIAAAAGVPVEVEERPARVAGGAVRLPKPPGIRLSFEGRLPGLLNLVAARSGYEWMYRGAPLRANGAIVFYRYWDVEQRSPQDRAQAAADRNGGAVTDWVVDPARHETLLDVLEDWGEDAGWSVVWKSGRRYAVRAGASFGGAFLDAVDLLMAAPATRRSLVALAHEPNRHLVIRDSGSPWSAEALR